MKPETEDGREDGSLVLTLAQSDGGYTELVFTQVDGYASTVGSVRLPLLAASLLATRLLVLVHEPPDAGGKIPCRVSWQMDPDPGVEAGNSH